MVVVCVFSIDVDAFYSILMCSFVVQLHYLHGGVGRAEGVCMFY